MADFAKPNYQVRVNYEHQPSRPQRSGASGQYEFTAAWFEEVRKIWDVLLPQIQPRTILEIGSYEGQSTVYLIEKLASQARIELHCIDNWGGGLENQATGFHPADMNAVEQRFLSNIAIASDRVGENLDLHIHKGNSDIELAKLLVSSKRNYFDFIYVDGSHQAPDVLFDAVVAFRMLKIGGVIAFDDYLWSEKLPGGADPIRCPKLAIDAFVNINIRKLEFSSRMPVFQIYARKIAE